MILQKEKKTKLRIAKKSEEFNNNLNEKKTKIKK